MYNESVNIHTEKLCISYHCSVTYLKEQDMIERVLIRVQLHLPGIFYEGKMFTLGSLLEISSVTRDNSFVLTLKNI